MNTNQTPAASASRFNWTADYHRVKDSFGWTLAECCVTEHQTQDEAQDRAKQICREHNALAGLEPGAVAGLVAAVEKYLQVNSVGNRAVLRAALAALKGGAK